MTVIWDWNGTLVDDIALTVRINNEVFDHYGYRHTDVETYRRIFRFPVRAYYRDLGVTDENFIAVADEWAAGYRGGFSACKLYDDAVETVRRFHEAGCRQVILSASKRDVLLEQVALYPGLNGMFDEILGIDNIYADGKTGLAREYLRSGRLDPADAVFLGDTCHDAEVADAIGVRCILISRGHQCEDVLKTAGKEIVPSLSAAAGLIL